MHVQRDIVAPVQGRLSRRFFGEESDVQNTMDDPWSVALNLVDVLAFDLPAPSRRLTTALLQLGAKNRNYFGFPSFYILLSDILMGMDPASCGIEKLDRDVPAVFRAW